jgi:predicted RNA-binding protein YlxR (DUF448 family)
VAEHVSVRKPPIRRCSGCGEHFPKGELIRVLRQKDGTLLLDLTGKQSGRGAYICKSLACFRRARKGKRMEAALGCAIPEPIYDRMEELLKNDR